MLAEFKACNAAALQSFSGELAARYATLKLAGLEEAPCQLVAFADTTTETGHGLGRKTMPEMTEYSVVAALLHHVACGTSGGHRNRVSILNPDHIKEILKVPQSWRLIGHFCLGYPLVESDQAALSVQILFCASLDQMFPKLFSEVEAELIRRAYELHQELQAEPWRSYVFRYCHHVR